MSWRIRCSGHHLVILVSIAEHERGLRFSKIFKRHVLLVVDLTWIIGSALVRNFHKTTTTCSEPYFSNILKHFLWTFPYANSTIVHPYLCSYWCFLVFLWCLLETTKKNTRTTLEQRSENQVVLGLSCFFMWFFS